MTPDGGADFAIFADRDIREIMERKPAAPFPAHLAIVRVQAPQYRSYSNEGYGRGRFSVVSIRDIEKNEDFERLSNAPAIVQVAPLNRLLLSDELDSDRELRHAAASLHADLLLIYTIDTDFFVDDKFKPLTVVSLGLSPNKEVQVTSTASAIVMDVRTGYIYGTCETTSREKKLASAWTDRSTVDRTRLETERQAFVELIGELETLLKRIDKPTPATNRSVIQN